MSNTDTHSLDRELNEALLAGDIMEAFERFYAEDVTMQENDTEPTRGKEANRAREKEFLANVEAFHGLELLGSAVNGDRSYSEWKYDFTLRGIGRLTYTLVASRRWRDGEVIEERFVYNPGS